MSIDVGGMLLRATVVDGAEPRIGARVEAVPEARRALLYRRSDGALLASEQGRVAPQPGLA